MKIDTFASEDCKSFWSSLIQCTLVTQTYECLGYVTNNFTEIVMTIGIVVGAIITIAAIFIASAILTICGFLVTAILVYAESKLNGYEGLVALGTQVDTLGATNADLQENLTRVEKIRADAEEDRRRLQREYEQFQQANQHLTVAQRQLSGVQEQHASALGKLTVITDRVTKALALVTSLEQQKQQLSEMIAAAKIEFASLGATARAKIKALAVEGR